MNTEIDPVRESYLKRLFLDMTPSSLADYSRTHPGDLDLHEYMTKYATPQTNQMVLIILDSSKPISRRKDRISNLKRP